jgi:rhodanese-related sulfurtransferase
MERTWKNILPEEVEKLVGNPNYEFIDVRSVGEYMSGHIKATKLISLDQLDLRYSEIDKSKEVIVICQAGGRSAMACDYLQTRGFEKLLNMAGGMNYWEGEVE